jgi:uncharacterized protein
MNLQKFQKASADRKSRNRDFYNLLKRRRPANLDVMFAKTHDEVFSEVNCLDCGNCCKTTSPIFYQRDIERAAKSLRLKPGIFIDKYLRIDEENDYVLKSSPCAFLAGDNRCEIYEDRPAACREYPHTNRKKMYQMLDLTFRNTMVCPAVLRITEKLQHLLDKTSN